MRRAYASDVPSIVELLADDVLGVARDGASGVHELAPYQRAFEAIDADSAHLLLVVEARGDIVATLQLSFLPGLSRRGALRAQIEAVRVRTDHRGSGVGQAMVSCAIDEARRRGCSLVQLSSDKRRAQAHRFYSAMGFVASHVGYKLPL